MTPRASRTSPLFGRSFRFLAVAFAILASPLAPRDASATLSSIQTRPGAPTTCDSVSLVVNGVMPDPCYHVIHAEIDGPTELPTAGPIPSFEIRVRITVQEPNPDLEIACPTVLQPYKRAFRLGLLTVGRYLVRGVEYTVPFSADSTAAAKDSSTLNTEFFVNGVAPCPPPGTGCANLSFAPSVPMRIGRCDGIAAPGGRACFDVVLSNETAVSGVQTEIAVFEPGAGGALVSPQLLHPVSVEVAGPGRTGFQASWTADGSRTKILLFTTTGATIPAGRAHILRVCYAVGANTPEAAYPMRFQNTVVADPEGGELPQCPTLVEIVGSICVVAKAGCDLNGDGSSDILDIVQLVHCALAGPGSDACPDTVAAKADCNGDGVINIRDVICCVRRILEGGGFGTGGGAPSDPNGATAIGFTGPVRWISPFEGRATIEIFPGTDFAGIQFGIDGSGSAARVRDVRLLDGSSTYQLETNVDPDGSGALAMLFPSGAGAAAQGPIRLEVAVEPAAGSEGGGGLQLVDARSANQAAEAMATDATSPTAEVPASPAANAPSLSAPSPNPFAAGTEIAYAIPAAQRVTLRVYSVSGRLVRTLVDAPMPAGVHRVPWDGRDSAGRETRSGIYFFKLKAGDVERTTRAMRLR